MFRSSLAVAACLIALTCVSFSPLIGQEDETSSRRQIEAIKAVQEAGGRVYRISAADSSREVSFALSGKPVGDKEIQNITAIKEIIWLNLAGTNVTNDGLKVLKDLSIEKLHLERTKVGDAGLKHLANQEELVYLNIYDTQVTDAGLEHLKKLKNLKSLYVWKSKVTEEGMKKLNESLPDLKIVGELKMKAVVVEEPKKKEPPKKADKKESDKKDAKKTKEKAGSKETAPAEKNASQEKKDDSKNPNDAGNKKSDK